MSIGTFDSEDESEFTTDTHHFCEWCQTWFPLDEDVEWEHPDHCPVQGNPILRHLLGPDFLDEFARRLLETPTIQAFLTGGNPHPPVTPGDGGVLTLHSLPSFPSIKGMVMKEGFKTPGNPGSPGGHLSPEVRAILESSDVDRDLIRYMDKMTGYCLALNNPKSGNLDDAPRLLKSFVRKDGFDARFQQWLKNNPAPYDPEKNPMDTI